MSGRQSPSTLQGDGLVNQQQRKSQKHQRIFSMLKSPKFIMTALKVKSSISSKSRGSKSDSSGSDLFEGGGASEHGSEDDPYYGEDDNEEVDPEDPYSINRIDEIPHEDLKEMYTQVVDELLDIQLEFEEKLADAEEQAAINMENQKKELDEGHQAILSEKEQDLERHKAAIGKLSDKLTKNMSALNQARATGGAASSAPPEDLQKLQDKLENLQEKYDDEKRQSIKTENQLDDLKAKMEKNTEQMRDQTRQVAKLEMENDELKFDVRQMGFMVEGLEEKLNSELEINELLKQDNIDKETDFEGQIDRLRQQLESAQTEVTEKDKEIKKIKFNQLMVETQFYKMNQGSNSARHATSVVHPPSTKRIAGDTSQIIGDPNNKASGQSYYQGDERKEDSPVNKDTSPAPVGPEKALPERPRDSLQSGEFENTSEKADEPRSERRQEKQNYDAEDKQAAQAPAEQREAKRSSAAAPPQAEVFNISPADYDQFGLEDIEIDNIDEILDCGDDLLEIEQTAFMGSSKIMLKMIDNMLHTIDTRIENVNPYGQYEQENFAPMAVPS